VRTHPVDDRCLLFFVRNPQKGPVKSRLARAVGADVARELYRNFLLDMLSMLESNDFPLIICFYPEDAICDLKNFLGRDYRYQPQRGADLGERMKEAFIDAFAMQFRRVVLIGSDIPDLPADIITEAFTHLEAVDAVLGPSSDGGYYLIGFNREGFLPEAFRGVLWGTAGVLKKTLSILRHNKQTVHLLPSWSDIDSVDDLKTFFGRNTDPSAAARTLAYLHRMKLLIGNNQQ